jgi:uncharacterized protein YndB with AHSA1/START domain
MEKVVTTMSFADEHGNPVPASHYNMPGKWPAEVILTATFEAVDGGKTKLTVREVGVPEEMAKFGRLGWEQSLDKFTESLK